MKTVTIEVASRAQADARFIKAAQTGRRKGAYITFPSVEALWSTITAKRWELVQALCGAGPLSVREAARRVGRDVKRVHEDVQVLLGAGILDRTQEGAVVFPYDGVHVDFVLRPSAIAA
jgi:predicted transcriptional regulator